MKLNRANAGVSKLPIRIVHLGVGAFHRAHQVWYTQNVDQEKEWGIAAFTGQNAKMAEDLSDQDCLFTLITRDSVGDTFTLMNQISVAKDINEPNALIECLRDPNVVLVTLTITEAGYTTQTDGILHKLALGIEERRISNGEPLTIISCDNLSSNGAITRRLLIELAMSDQYLKFLEEKVGFISTSVDRITPQATAGDVRIVAEEFHWNDAIPVVTEPFSSWVLSGEFRTKRPSWELSGAQFVDEIEVYENRKLWLLNGSHSYLAYRGLNQGFEFVAEAIADPAIRTEVKSLWAESAQFIDLDLEDYTDALLGRFENGRLSYRLSQIAIDGSLKLKMRCSEVVKRQLMHDRDPISYSRLFAEWIRYLRMYDYQDSQRNNLKACVTVADYIKLVDEELIKFPRFISAIESHLMLNSNQ
jgi:fructuronate reductase